MRFVNFLVNNARWVAGGFLLTFFSSFGQTFFIALSAGDIRAEYDLSHGGFGMLYMFATLASALTLPRLGKTVDTFRVVHVLALTAPMLALACFALAFSNSLVLLAVAIYGLRLFGQGMMTHIAMTAMGKWFAAQRGRAVSFSAIGVNFGEALFPLAFVLVAGLIGWRNSWVAAGLVLLLVAFPAIFALMRVEREPQSVVANINAPPVHNWTRSEVLRDPFFYVLLTGVLAPPFIGTTIFFHQVYLVELRGWSQEAFAASFVLMSSMTVIFALVCGHLVDRFSALRLLPFFLIPLAVACITLAAVTEQYGVFFFMALLGLSYGFSGTLFGAVWPEVYGIAHLGSIRSMIVAVMVFMTAVGPGLTGTLIDMGVPYSGQILAFGVYCLMASVVLFAASARLRARLRGSVAIAGAQG
ncbi:MFS transporter [Oricola cellulosilytica]|uniref:MFS transporter n=1 Tax=Oricola cellulosilytica TaxID=1429082 RepID=A0A4R0PAA1_9HYPH|nr:MFS transporter [Oricola cellulosilytica]TCD11795.1 MFS transporter [Oricola cellulosilytica]